MRIFRAAVFFLLCCGCVCLPAFSMAESVETEDGYSYREPFTADYYLSGSSMVLYEYLHLGGWDISGATLTLSYETSPLLQSQTIHLIAYINGASLC